MHSSSGPGLLKGLTSKVSMSYGVSCLGALVDSWLRRLQVLQVEAV